MNSAPWRETCPALLADQLDPEFRFPAHPALPVVQSCQHSLPVLVAPALPLARWAPAARLAQKFLVIQVYQRLRVGQLGLKDPFAQCIPWVPWDLVAPWVRLRREPHCVRQDPWDRADLAPLTCP